jgi:CheY-like chemotaxis protein
LGLGLSLVKRLVDMHGGTVEAFSEGPGQGSELVVRLRSLPSLPACDPGTAVAPAPSREGLRLLVVDDNRDAADSLALLLGSDGNRVATAYDGETALDLAISEHPHLVLLDIGLPGMNGYAVAEALRQRVDLPGLRLVAITGYGQPEDRERTKAAGFDAHLVKPVDFEALRVLMAEYRIAGH